MDREKERQLRYLERKNNELRQKLNKQKLREQPPIIRYFPVMFFFLGAISSSLMEIKWYWGYLVLIPFLIFYLWFRIELSKMEEVFLEKENPSEITKSKYGGSVRRRKSRREK